MGFLYPVTLDVEDRTCLLVGEGEETERKAAWLEAAGAVVRRATRFSADLLDGVFLAILAGQPAEDNALAFEQCEARGILLNCLDDSANCRFSFPSIHRQGDLTIAVSTNGACPALAVRIRETLGREYGPEYAAFLEMCRSLRERVKRTIPDFERRRALWYRLIDSPALELLRMGREKEARDQIDSQVTDANRDREQ
jgi:siroheme synthase-like protein